MRIITLFLLFITFQTGWSQTEWKHSEITYKDALIQAKKENKPLFIMLYATWCPHCNTMKSTVFNDASIIDFLNKNFICVWKDIEKKEGIALKKKYETVGLPTFLFVDANETVLYSIKGEMQSGDFMREATNALNTKLQLPYLEKQFYADPSDANKCLTYLTVLRKGKERPALGPATNTYLATQTDSQLISEINWRIISNGVSDIQSKEFQFVLNHKKEYEKVASPIRVERKIENIVSELLEPYTNSLDTVNYYKKREIAKTIQLQKIDSLIFSYDLVIGERTKNWSYYKKATLEGTEKYIWNSNTIIKEIGQNYLKEINDVVALEKAIGWVKHSLELNDSYDGNLLVGNLYFKIKDKKQALEYAKKAKDIAMEMGWKTKDADALLLKLK